MDSGHINALHQLNLTIESSLMESEESWYGQVTTMVINKTDFCGMCASLHLWKNDGKIYSYCTCLGEATLALVFCEKSN